MEKEKIIINEQDIINTYPERNKEIANTYLNYLKIKKENPDLGYKKLSRILNKPVHTTRNWHHNSAVPEPLNTVKWLKEKGLIPLSKENNKINLIAKIAGATFSDGGIFQSLNAIFLSSSELESAKEFGEDLKLVFGEEIESNSRIIEGGEYGHSWCYQNTNRNVIRFFKALGCPIGRKSEMPLILPEWVFLENGIADEFIGSIVGGDGGIPKYTCGSPNPITIGITGRDHLKQNRIHFLEQIREYFNKKGIESNKLYISASKETNIFNLPFRSILSNFLNFYDNISINYCKYKKIKLENTLKSWKARQVLEERKWFDQLRMRQDRFKKNSRLHE